MPTSPHAPSSVRTTPTVLTAALLSGGQGETLDLRTADGALLRLPLSPDALAEIAALATAALRDRPH
ncbi:hypothetical protein [Roseomonas sp. BN140053]|uniref:hypothetical protein n=1 Tax=Roseomonas sp. BN140053 TaxID=3391898 RepID=UPI0039E852EC